MPVSCSLLTRVFAFVLFLGASWAPAQDRAYNALPLLTAYTIGNNLGATTVGSDPYPYSCVALADVWYYYVAPCNGVVSVDTCGSATNFDTVLYAYDATCGPNSLIQLTCNDDFCTTRSYLTFTATQGITYYISVAGYGGQVGTFELHVACAPGYPTHDDCISASNVPVILPGYWIVGNNVGASLPGLCNASADVWYRFAPSVSGNVTISTCNADVGGMTNFDTILSVFQGFSCGGLSSVGCNDDACGGLQSRFTFAVTPPNSYWVSVGGYGGATGRFGYRVSQDNDLAFRFFDQGPGTIGFRISGAPGYYYYFFGTTHAGAYPNGFFYGIDISIADIYYELGVGPPFTGPLTPCGTVGPFGPLPPGLTIYGVALGTPTAGGYPTAVSAPASYTIL